MAEIVKVCKVMSIDDPADCGRIIAHVIPSDDEILTRYNEDVTNPKYKEESSWAYPLLPKYLWIKPKVGDTVLVFTAVAENNFSQRYYIGPIFPQLHDTQSCDGLNAQAGMQSSVIGDPEKLRRETYGAVPQDDDISIIGRKDCDIQITDNDIRIKAGMKHFYEPNKFMYNTEENGAFIKLKYDYDGFEDKDGETIHSTATIVADRINLIGNNPKPYSLYSQDSENGSVNDNMKKDLIPDSEMKKILEEAHQLPYGDILVEFLNVFKNAFNCHTHSWVGPGCTPIKNASYVTFNSYPIDNILSNNVRIL